MILPILTQCFSKDGKTCDFECRFSRETPKNREFKKRYLTIVSGWVKSFSESSLIMLQIISTLKKEEKVIGKGEYKVIKASETIIFRKRESNFFVELIRASVLGVVARKNNPKTAEEVLRKNDISFIQAQIQVHVKLFDIFPADAHLIIPPICYKPFITPSGKLKLEFELPRCASDVVPVLRERRIPLNFMRVEYRELRERDLINYFSSICKTLLYFEQNNLINCDVRRENLCIARFNDLYPTMIDLDHISDKNSERIISRKVKHWDGIANEFHIMTPFLHVCSLAYIIGHSLNNDFGQSLLDGDLKKGNDTFECSMMEFMSVRLKIVGVDVVKKPDLNEFDQVLEQQYEKNKAFPNRLRAIVTERANLRLAQLVLEIYRFDDLITKEAMDAAPMGLEYEDRRALCKFFLKENEHRFISIEKCLDRLNKISEFIQKNWI